MPEEQTTEPLSAGSNQWLTMTLREQRLWLGAFVAVFFFIGIAILCSGHHHRRPYPMMHPPGWEMWMRPQGFGPPPPPPAWGGPGDYYGRGWGPGAWPGYPGNPPAPPAQQPPPPPPRG